MLSSDKNVDTIARLIEALRHYLGLQAEYVKLDVVDKVVRLLTAAALLLLLLFIMAMVVVVVSLGAAAWLSARVGLGAAVLIVAAVLVFVLLLVFAFRRQWIERPLVRFLSRLLTE